jgi:hypothetical protein
LLVAEIKSGRFGALEITSILLHDHDRWNEVVSGGEMCREAKEGEVSSSFVGKFVVSKIVIQVLEERRGDKEDLYILVGSGSRVKVQSSHWCFGIRLKSAGRSDLPKQSEVESYFL